MSLRAARRLVGMRFNSTIELGGKTATGIPVPDAVVAALGAGRQPLVVVTVAGHTYRSRIGVRGGECKIPLSAEHREPAGAAAGDEFVVEIALDTAPREVFVPPPLAEALASHPAARAAFDRLSPSRRKALTLPVESAKTD